MYMYTGKRLSHPLAKEETKTFSELTYSPWPRFFELLGEHLAALEEVFWVIGMAFSIAFVFWAYMQ